MRIADDAPLRARRRFACFSVRLLAVVLAVFAAGAVPALAHPVAQGAMELRVEPGRLVLDVHASMEQVLVQAAYGPAATAALAERVRLHGDYLRAHLRLAADGEALQAGPAEALAARPGRAAWRLVFPLPVGSRPARLALWQDVLREIEYAPGNPWETSYVLRVSGAATGAGAEGGLLASAQTLSLALRPVPATPATPATPAAAPPAPAVPVVQWIAHGLRHILAGYDHLLFVAALTLGARRLGELVRLVGAFTLAHTLTLALSVLDVFRLPSGFVEPMIAASIVAVALLNVFGSTDARTPRRRLLCAFGFGLFHGLGFAGGLLEAFADLGGGAAVTAILAFSIGVEGGHLAVVLPLWALLAALRHRHAGSDPRALRRGASVAISLAGLLYLAAALGHGPLA